MNKSFLFLSIFISSVFTLPLFSQELKFSGEAGSIWAAAIGSENRGDLLLGDVWLNGKFEAFYGNSCVYAEGRVGFDDVESQTYKELKEIYLDYTADFFAFRAGRQKAVWGKADGIDITNVICPKDYSSTRALFDDENLAIDGLRLSLNKGSLCADFYYIPFFTPASLPKKQEAQLSSVDLPQKNLKNSEYGVKVSGYFSILDFSFYGFYGFEDSPFLDYSLSEQGLKADGCYKKMAMLGADAAVPVKNLVFRLEGAFFPKRHFQSTGEKILLGSKNTEEHNNVLALAGLDWMPESWTFTAQYFCDYVFKKNDNLERENSLQHGVTFSLSKSLFAQTLELSAAAVLMLNDLDSAIELSAEYSLSDSIFLEAGGNLFNEGKEPGTYGSYKNYTSLYLKARYVF